MNFPEDVDSSVVQLFQLGLQRGIPLRSAHRISPSSDPPRPSSQHRPCSIPFTSHLHHADQVRTAMSWLPSVVLIKSTATSSCSPDRAKWCVSSPTLLSPPGLKSSRLTNFFAASRQVVHHSLAQREGQDHQGCDPAGSLAPDANVQLPRIQRWLQFTVTSAQQMG